MPSLREVLIAMKNIKPEASPGYPYCTEYPTNQALFADHQMDIACLVYDRLQKLSEGDYRHLTAEEAVEAGLCDPVRIFVKNEPHNRLKASQLRWRLIFSVSVVDQLVEVLLGATQNKREIARWHKIPSKPGMGLTDEHAEKLVAGVSHLSENGRFASSDISGWDFSVQHHELQYDAEMRIALWEDPDPKAATALRNRMHFMGLSVLVCSDGHVFAQSVGGILKSGSYFTSSTNSRIRVLLARVAGTDAVAMGDDAIEKPCEGIQERYTSLGRIVKEYRVSDEIAFCSHTFGVSRLPVPEDPSKMVYRFVSKTSRTSSQLNEEFHQLLYELRHWPGLAALEPALADLVGLRQNDSQESSSPRPQPQDPQGPSGEAAASRHRGASV